MRKSLLVLLAVLGLVGVAGANLITQDEAKVGGVLQELKLESVKPKDPTIVGAPPRYRVTKATIDYLEKLMKDGKMIEVQGNGSLKIVK